MCQPTGPTKSTLQQLWRFSCRQRERKLRFCQAQDRQESSVLDAAFLDRFGSCEVWVAATTNCVRMIVTIHDGRSRTDVCQVVIAGRGHGGCSLVFHGWIHATGYVSRCSVLLRTQAKLLPGAFVGGTGTPTEIAQSDYPRVERRKHAVGTKDWW